MHRRTITMNVAVAIGVFLGVGQGVTCGDTVELSADIRVDGKVLRTVDGSDKPAVILEVDPELRIAIPQQRVKRTTLNQSEKMLWYRKLVEAAGNDADAHYELARTCKANGLLAQRDFHFQRAIELDPNHSKARSALKYVRDGNDWILYSEQQKKRGLINTTGGWQVPEVHLRKERMEEYDDAAKRWKKDFAKMRASALRPGKRQAEALEALRTIDDPVASAAIAEALEKSSGKEVDPLSMRKLYVKKLAEFRTPIAIQTFVKLGLFEPDSNIRRAVLEELQKYGAPSAVATYLNILRKKDHKRAEVKAALQALQYFPDAELWRVYIDALITEHKFVKPPGPSMSVGTNSLGGSGMSTGGKAEVIITNQQNPDALQLLREIAPGVDFRYDKNAWLRYFAEQLTGSSSDLRRDP